MTKGEQTRVAQPAYGFWPIQFDIVAFSAEIRCPNDAYTRQRVKKRRSTRLICAAQDDARAICLPQSLQTHLTLRTDRHSAEVGNAPPMFRMTIAVNSRWRPPLSKRSDATRRQELVMLCHDSGLPQPRTAHALRTTIHNAHCVVVVHNPARQWLREFRRA